MRYPPTAALWCLLLPLAACDGRTPDGTLGSTPDAGLSTTAVTFTIQNHTSVPLSLPGGRNGRWLEIGLSGYSLWPASRVSENALCDADAGALGTLPPPDGELPVDGEYSYEWSANAFIGSEPIPGISEEYYCATAGHVPDGETQFLVCARQANVLCQSGDREPFPPRLVCASMMAEVTPGSNASFAFTDEQFPTENCPQAEEVPQ